MALHLVVGDHDFTDTAEQLTWSSVDPGGHEFLSFTVPSLDDLPTLGDRVRLFEGLEPLFDGRVEEAGQDHHGQTATGRVSCVGAGAALRDTEYNMVYVDRDLARWGATGVQRKTTLITAGYRPLDPSTAVSDPSGTRDAALLLAVQGGTASGGLPAVEALYDAGPNNTIKSIYQDIGWSSNVSAADANWSSVFVSQTNGYTDGETSADQHPSGAAALITFSTARRFVLASFSYSSTSGLTTQASYEQYIHDLAAFGDHGLTKRGSAPDQGFYTSDIAGHALTQATGIDAGPIEQDTGLVILQAAYYDPTTPERVIDDMARRAGFHWGVWANPDGTGNPQLHMVSPPETATAVISRADCDSFQPSQRLSSLYDTVNVRYQDPASGPGIETVTRPNPFLPAALAGRERTVDLGQGSSSAAAAYGAMLLALWEQQARAAGPVTITAPVQIPGGGTRPAHLLRAGLDRLQVTDLPNAGPWTETDTRRFDTFRIRRAEHRVDRGGRVTTQVELDAGADLTETLNARLQDAVGIVD